MESLYVYDNLTCEGISGDGSDFGLFLRESSVFNLAAFALSCLKYI